MFGTQNNRGINKHFKSLLVSSEEAITRVMAAAACSDLRLDHVDASGAEGFDAVVDVHHALALGHVQHDVQHDVAAGASGAHAATHGSVHVYAIKP